jgi:hypothetical protein
MPWRKFQLGNSELCNDLMPCLGVDVLLPAAAVDCGTPKSIRLSAVDASDAVAGSTQCWARAWAHSGRPEMRAFRSTQLSSIHSISRSRGMRTDPPTRIDGSWPPAAMSSTFARLIDNSFPASAPLSNSGRLWPSPDASLPRGSSSSAVSVSISWWSVAMTSRFASAARPGETHGRVSPGPPSGRPRISPGGRWVAVSGRIRRAS